MLFWELTYLGSKSGDSRKPRRCGGYFCPEGGGLSRRPIRNVQAVLPIPEEMFALCREDP